MKKRSDSATHLAFSLTDLMTSLMVIFVLLLLVFLKNRASVDTVATQALLQDMRRELSPDGLTDIRTDPRDPFTIEIPIPGDLLTFQPNRAELSAGGQKFVRDEMPRIAGVICQERYRASIEGIIIEGHSDGTPYKGLTAEESQNRNLKLSQDRAMDVVQDSLEALGGDAQARGCFIEKLTASGRGEQDREATEAQSRRVVLKVRVNSRNAELLRELHASEPEVPPITPAVAKVLNIYGELLAKPPHHVEFELTEAEVNEYARYSIRTLRRPGIEDVNVKLLPGDNVSVSAVIDFDALERERPGTIPAVFQPLLNGKKRVSLDVHFRAQDGSARLEVQKAVYQDVALPQFLARKMVQVIGYLQPEKINTDDEFPLPAGVKKLSTAAAEVRGSN